MPLMQWEYRVETRREPGSVAWLNELGAQGWELVDSEPVYDAMGTFQPQLGHVLVFKRWVYEEEGKVEEFSEDDDGASEKPLRVGRRPMSEANRQKARERMQAMHERRQVKKEVLSEPTEFGRAFPVAEEA